MKLFCYGDDVPDRPCCSLDSINDARDVAHSARHSALRAQPRGPLRPARDPELRERVQPRAARRFRACAATRSPSSATCWPTPMRSTATTSPPATTPSPGTARSTAGATRAKDQSYFLWGIDRAVVARMLTPVGEMTKAETRALRAAARAGHGRQAGVGGDLLRAGRRLRRRARAAPARPTRRRSRPGPLVTTAGEVDRRARRATPGTPSASGGGCPAAFARAALRGGDPAGAARGRGRHRGRAGRAPGAPGGAQLAGRSARAGRRVRGPDPLPGARRARRPSSRPRTGPLELALAAPVRAITPGQSGVLYAPDDRVLGGGCRSR